MVVQEEKKKLNFCQKFANTCRGFGNFLYSKRDVNGVEQSLVMGRNGSSWAKIGLFYICFYSFLAGFFAAMLAVFLTTIQKPGEGPPKLTQFIANKPGLTIVNEVLSGYKLGDDNTLKGFQKKVDDFLKGYNAEGYSDQFCVKANKTGYPEGEKPCKFNTAFLKAANCTKDTYYGLKTKKPCILVKMNKVYGWVPAGDTEVLELSCTSGENVIKVVNGGYLKAAMPFRGQKFYVNPIAVVQVPVEDKAVEVRCQLKGDKIEVSDSYNPKRAFGKIEFTVAAPTT